MSILIENMDMPTTGLYLVSVDNSSMAVERMLWKSEARQIIGAFEFAPVPPHGRLIDADNFLELCNAYAITPSDHEFCKRLEYALTRAATIIPAEEG